MSAKTGHGASIDRRDFISGVAAVALSSQVPLPAASGEAVPKANGIAGSVPYPPAATGLRGQYPGSFETAHLARDGQFAGMLAATETDEHFDLVVVGAGISGLSAAYFFRQALGDDRKILVFDNHDDFGGHAKRNEFHYGGRMYLGYGGTMSIETPFPYSFTAKSLIADLGIDVMSYAKHVDEHLYTGLSEGVFFDREHFGKDRLVAGLSERPWADVFRDAPLTPAVRADLTRLHTESVDYLAALDVAAKIERLKHISYADYLTQCARLLPQSLSYFAGTAFRNNMRVDTCPAYTAARSGAVGFAGLNLPPDPMFQTDYEFHFPDGNASIARLLVNRLVPGVFAGGQTMERIVTARADYSALDAATDTRIRLQSTVVRVENVGDAGRASTARVTYVRQGQLQQVTADNVVLACFNNIVPYIVPTLPEDQKRALAYASKVPMQYTNVLIRNWRAWQRLGVHFIHAPNGYHTWCGLDIPVSLGSYRFPSDPEQPIVVHMVRNPNRPGLPRREQHRLGRAEMLATPFETIEAAIRDQLQRMLGAGGFDAQRDVLGITVNRWPHGYAYTYDTLGDPNLPEAQRPHVLGRRAFGRISIANADAGAAAFTNVAIDQAERAIQDVLSSRGLV